MACHAPGVATWYRYDPHRISRLKTRIFVSKLTRSFICRTRGFICARGRFADVGKHHLFDVEKRILHRQQAIAPFQHKHTHSTMLLSQQVATVMIVAILLPWQTLAFVAPRPNVAGVASTLQLSSKGDDDFWEKQKQLVADMNASSEKSLRA
jgi:hypothetical protein